MTGVLLVGCGKMGGALLEGWRKNKAAERFVVIEPMEAAVAHLSDAADVTVVDLSLIHI